MIRRLYKLNTSLWQLEACLKELLHDHEGKTINEIKDELDSISANMDNLRDLLPSLRNYAQISSGLKKV
jgi:hypothetical protein